MKPVVAVSFLTGGLVVSDPPRFIVVIFVVGVIASFAWLVPAVCTRLRVASRGITLSPSGSSEEQVHVPWSSVREVVVVTDPRGSHESVSGFTTARLCRPASGDWFTILRTPSGCRSNSPARFPVSTGRTRRNSGVPWRPRGN